MGNVLQLAVTTLCNSQQDMVDRVNDLADAISDGDYGEINTIVAVIETKDGQVRRHTIGAPCDRARATGLLATAVVRAATDE